MNQLFRGSLPTRNRVFTHFLSASSCSLLGSYIFDFSIPLYVLQKTGSAMALSATLVALHLPFFVMAPLTGYIVDHGSKRKTMLYSDIGQVVCMLVFLAMEQTHMASLWPILILIFSCKTMVIAFETVATFQLIPALVKPKDLHDANSWFLSSQRLIQIVGPLVGGLLMSTLGFQSCILVNAASFATTLYFVMKMRHLDRLIEGENTPKGLELSLFAVFKNFRKSVIYVWRSALFKPFILMMFFWNLSSLCNNTPTLTYYFNSYVNFSPLQYGITLSFIGLLGLTGFLVAPYFYRQLSFQKAFHLSAVTMAGLGMLAAISFEFPTGLVIFYGLSRFGSSILSMGTFVLRQTNIPRSMTGGVNASLRMFFMSAMPLSSYVQGILLTHLPIQVSLIVGACFLTISSFFAFHVSKAFIRIQERSALRENKAA